PKCSVHSSGLAMEQGSESSNEIPVVGREGLPAVRADNLRIFAFQLGRRYAELMDTLRRRYATLRRQRQSTDVSPPAIASQRSAPHAPWASRRRARRSATARVVGAYVVLPAAVIIAGAVAFAAAMFWAVGDISLDASADHTSRPSFLLEASNGTPLGRIGPL